MFHGALRDGIETAVVLAEAPGAIGLVSGHDKGSVGGARGKFGNRDNPTLVGLVQQE